MPLYLFYTMVQKSQKWPKIQIKGSCLKSYERHWTFGDGRFCVQLCIETLCKWATSVAHLTNFSFEFFYEFSQMMPLYFFYTMVQKSQKWPKTQIQGGPALIGKRRRWCTVCGWSYDHTIWIMGGGVHAWVIVWGCSEIKRIVETSLPTLPLLRHFMGSSRQIKHGQWSLRHASRLRGSSENLPCRQCNIYRADTRTHSKLQTYASSEMILDSQEERHDRHEVRMRENKRERSRAGENEHGDRYHGAQPVKVASPLNL